MADLPIIGFFALATFLANFAFSAMSFGMAIVFLFIYQIGSMAGLFAHFDCCGLKYAVFIQTFGLFVIQPLVLWSVGIRKNHRLELLVPFLIVQFVGTPLGQYLQDFTPTPILQLVIGCLTILVGFKQFHNIYKTKMSSKQDPTGVVDTRNKVFFMVGCQRSGSNWLQLLISQKHPQIASPHPPHILKSFYPIMNKFGDLQKDENFQYLIEKVCQFVEVNPVPWMDRNTNSPIIFDRQDIFDRCNGKRTLIAVFEAVMDTFAQANDSTTWICKSMGVAQYHQDLLDHFGERLHYIYLVRDPREVCLSFKKAPIGDSHLFVIAEKWKKLQQNVFDLIEKVSKDKMYLISYESLLKDKEAELQALSGFLLGTETKEAIVDMNQHDKYITEEAALRAEKSKLWQNLNRKISLVEEQMIKAESHPGLSEADIKHIEASCFNEMEKLGYALVNKEHIPRVTQLEIEQFEQENEEGNKLKQEKLKMEDPEDWQRRQNQADVLKTLKIERVELETKSDRETCKWWPLKPVIFFMLLTGFLDGFLGGLVGVRGPPLLLFFIFFDYPNSQVKANGAIIAATNTLIRIVTYAFKAPPESYGYKSWFVPEDLSLYLAVALAGIVSSQMGIAASRYINKWTFKAALVTLLVINGLTMITTGSINLSY